MLELTFYRIHTKTGHLFTFVGSLPIENIASELYNDHSGEKNMQAYLEISIELIKAQAAVRPMSTEEMTSAIEILLQKLKTMDGQHREIHTNGKAFIKKQSVTCLECGEHFRILTNAHLKKHSMNKNTYREKWGIERGTPLVCRDLAGKRRKVMSHMELWKRRLNCRNTGRTDG